MQSDCDKKERKVHVVKKSLGEPEVVEKVADPDLRGIRHDKVIPLRNRFQHPPINLPVELEHFHIEGFPGIVFLDAFFAGLREGVEGLI